MHWTARLKTFTVSTRWLPGRGGPKTAASKPTWLSQVHYRTCFRLHLEPVLRKPSSSLWFESKELKCWGNWILTNANADLHNLQCANQPNQPQCLRAVNQMKPDRQALEHHTNRKWKTKLWSGEGDPLTEGTHFAGSNENLMIPAWPIFKPSVLVQAKHQSWRNHWHEATHRQRGQLHDMGTGDRPQHERQWLRQQSLGRAPRNWNIYISERMQGLACWARRLSSFSRRNTDA